MKTQLKSSETFDEPTCLIIVRAISENYLNNNFSLCSKNKCASFYKHGFGLIETLIAIAVLLMVLMASITLGTVTLRNMTVRAQTTQATALAQEQLEIVRNIRDNVWLNSNFTPSSCKTWDCWTNSDHRQQVKTGPLYMTQFNPTSKEWYLAEGSELPSMTFGNNSSIAYTRTVKVTKIDPAAIQEFSVANSDELLKLSQDEQIPNSHGIKIYLVESTVTWETYGRTNNITLRTYLSDWLPRS